MRTALDPRKYFSAREKRGFAWMSGGVLGIGGLFFPVVGWGVGIVLVWLSTCWTRRQKFVATIAMPICGLCAALFVGVGVALPTWHVSSVSLWNILVVTLLVVVIASVVTAIWLLRRVRAGS